MGTEPPETETEPWGDQDVSELLKLQVRTTQAGYNDSLWLRAENVAEVFTEKRIEIIDLLASDTGEIESMRDVARRLDRHVSVVKEDLDVLVTHGIVGYERDGQRKVPVLTHPHVFVQPVLLNGEFQHEQFESGADTPE